MKPNAKQNVGKVDGPADRRGFLKSALVMIIGSVAAVVPWIAGIMVATDPLRRKTASADGIRVTTLEALRVGGLPQKFPIIAGKTDAWNKYQDVPIGAVYLRRTAERTVEALNVVCPHAGCFVDFSGDDKKFHCPCHKSSFAMDGTIADPKSPSPRPLDSLLVKVDEQGDVWVTFQNFQAGQRAKVPAA